MEMEIKSSQGQSVLAVIGASRKQKRKGTDKIWFYFGIYRINHISVYSVSGIMFRYMMVERSKIFLPKF